MRTCRWIALGAAVVAGAGAWPQGALASENYPATLDRFAGLEESCSGGSQRCLICHSTVEGGEGTADQPFALALAELVEFDQGEAGRALNTALIEFRDEVVETRPELDEDGDGVNDLDSDEDGVSDLDELAACTNPSGEFGSGAEFGCDGARLSAGTPGWRSGAAALLGLLALGLRRRRRN